MTKSRNIYMMFDGAENTREKVAKKIYPKAKLLGGFNLEKEGFLKIKNDTLRNTLRLKRGDIAIINRTRYIPFMKILLELRNPPF